MSGTEGSSEGKLEDKDSDNHDLIAIIQAASRMAMGYGCQIYLVKNGFQGMIIGGDFLCETNWNGLSEESQGSGVFGSSECEYFRKRAGRLQACKNLVTLKISNLVCIGGDSSLIMARRFRAEWSSLLKELVDINQVPEESVQDCRTLHLFRYKLGYDKNCFRFGAELSSLGQNRATKGIGPVAIFACHDDASGDEVYTLDGNSTMINAHGEEFRDEDYGNRSSAERRMAAIDAYAHELLTILEPIVADIMLPRMEYWKVISRSGRQSIEARKSDFDKVHHLLKVLRSKDKGLEGLTDFLKQEGYAEMARKLKKFVNGESESGNFTF